MVSTLLSVAMLANTMVTALPPEPTYEDLGTMRVSEYCESCNDPGGRQTSTGEEPHAGTCAGPEWLVGSTIYIDGEELYVNDVCGCSNTIDIWVEGECGEDFLEYRDVTRKVEE